VRLLTSLARGVLSFARWGLVVEWDKRGPGGPRYSRSGDQRYLVGFNRHDWVRGPHTSCGTGESPFRKRSGAVAAAGRTKPGSVTASRGKPEAFPLVKATAEGADAFDAQLVEGHCHFGGGGLAGQVQKSTMSRSRGNLDMALGQHLWGKMERAGEP